MKKLGIIGVVFVVIFWWTISSANIVDAFFLPNPIEVFLRLAKLLLADAKIQADIIITLRRVFLTLILSIAIGVPLGIILGWTREIYSTVEIIIDFLRSTPITALFPLFLLIFGIGDGSKIGVATFSSVLLISFNTAHGVMNAKKTRLLAAQIMGANKRQIFLNILFWESLPQTLIGLRTAASWILVIIVVTEMFIGSSVGIGRRIIDFQYIYDIAGMYAMIIVAGLIGYFLNFLFSTFEKKTVHWVEK